MIMNDVNYIIVYTGTCEANVGWALTPTTCIYDKRKLGDLPLFPDLYVVLVGEIRSAMSSAVNTARDANDGLRPVLLKGRAERSMLTPARYKEKVPGRMQGEVGYVVESNQITVNKIFEVLSLTAKDVSEPLDETKGLRDITAEFLR